MVPVSRCFGLLLVLSWFATTGCLAGRVGAFAGPEDAGPTLVARPDAGPPPQVSPDAGQPPEVWPDAGSPDAGAVILPSCPIHAAEPAHPFGSHPAPYAR